jgi:3-oxoadipate enol-lactonase
MSASSGIAKYDSRNMAILNQQRTRVSTRDGKWLNALIDGVGEKTLVFLHGLGENHNFFTHQINEFGNSYKIISLDQRGHGLSYRLKKPERHSLQTWVNDVEDLLDFSNVKKAVIMGHSFGSTVALKFAVDHPSRVAGVITTGGLSEIEPEPWKQMELWIRDYEKNGDEAAWKLLKGYDPEWDLNAEFARSPENQQLTSRMRQVFAEDDPYNFIEGARAILEFALSPELPRVMCPVLILGGDVDIFVPVTHHVKLSTLIPYSFLKVMHAAHNPHIEQPQLTNSLIQRFLRCIDW